MGRFISGIAGRPIPRVMVNDQEISESPFLPALVGGAPYVTVLSVPRRGAVKFLAVGSRGTSSENEAYEIGVRLLIDGVNVFEIPSRSTQRVITLVGLGAPWTFAQSAAMDDIPFNSLELQVKCKYSRPGNYFNMTRVYETY